MSPPPPPGALHPPQGREPSGVFEQRQHRSRLLWETGMSHRQASFRGGKICCLVKIVTQACQGPAGGRGRWFWLSLFGAWLPSRPWGAWTLLNSGIPLMTPGGQWHPAYELMAQMPGSLRVWPGRRIWHVCSVVTCKNNTGTLLLKWLCYQSVCFNRTLN